MKRLDQSKTSLVEFLSSIRFNRRNKRDTQASSGEQFARFDQQVRPARLRSLEDQLLVRSAN
ncbi:hypothetical protein E4634_06920 [Mangrovimicrobium sediminis]|uniref:Uncharacterized protein n=1 Tax=Mangrovimicrobium sediminis TaxID=2562682 RepID=A0A4Z0M2W4_9GAMM|nr:hypothetical protein [Haliea sp. SAOS-164]TGD73869.1 hypothetical protein E4634_06920 [Haliea sp. SAOS-164]